MDGSKPYRGRANLSEVLGIDVERLTLARAAESLEQMSQSSPSDGGARLVVTLNVEMTMKARKDPELFAAISDAALVVPDSIGIKWAGRLPAQVPGIELIAAVAELASDRGASLYLLGAAAGVAERAGKILASDHPGLRIIGTRDGYFNADQEASVLHEVKSKRPDYVLVALGAGRQEKWIARNRGALGPTVALGVGGSLDVISGDTQRAPEWARRLNIEWLYRITTQPSRLGRSLALPHFMLVVLGRRIFGRSST